MGYKLALAGNAIWMAEISYVISVAAGGNTPAPYGDRTPTGAGTSALIESWGYHVGCAYAHRRYGGNRQSLNGTSPTLATSWRWLDEDDVLLQDEFIPSGLLNDLVDLNASNPAGLIENPNVDDLIGNFSRSQIFSEMGSGTHNIQDLRVKLRALGIKTGGANTTARFDNLMADYGL